MIATLKPSPRKTRTKLRKPKFLSLRLQLTPTAQPPPMPTDDHQNQLINLFPLHPENLVQQHKLDDDHDHELEHSMAACIFSSCDDHDGAATTLTGILDDDEEEEEEENTNNPSPSSVNYADEEVELVRTAMRRNKTERDDDDEKWVCYSEVVERKKVVTGMTSSSSSSTSCKYNENHHHHHRSKLVLKLDYEKIMKSWVNKGPLYIRSNSDLQTVPDLQDDDFLLPSSITTPIHGVAYDEHDNGGNGGSWTVPELTGIENNEGEDALQGVGSNVMTHNREASVQRYKEKRRNRLFAKTIRYEVRKLNAEKRPRIKGRFVKRN